MICCVFSSNLRRWALLLFAVFLCSAAGCATNPVSGKQEFVLMSEQQELALGKELDPTIRKDYGVYGDPELQRYVDGLGQRLAALSHRPDIFFHFTVLDSPLVNAFALPGGYIYITRGLLAYINSEAELAGVLGHEIGHVTARHAVRQYTKAASYQIGAGIASVVAPEAARAYGELAGVVFAAIQSGYSREYETEADRLAMTYAARTGYDPGAITSLLNTLMLIREEKNGGSSYTSLFATHPKAETRISRVLEEMNLQGLESAGSSLVKRQTYLQHIDGLLFGSDVHAGVVAGAVFRHPDLQIEVVFPDGWPVENKPDAVRAEEPGGSAFVELRLYRLSKKISLEAAAQRIAHTYGFRLLSTGGHTTVNGMRAYVASYGGRSSDAGPVVVRAGFFKKSDTVMYIFGVAPTDRFVALNPVFERTIESFRQLTDDEAESIKPTCVHLYRVARPCTLAEVLQKLGRQPAELRTVSLLNGWDPDAAHDLRPGMAVKVLRNQ